MDNFETCTDLTTLMSRFMRMREQSLETKRNHSVAQAVQDGFFLIFPPTSAFKPAHIRFVCTIGTIPATICAFVLMAQYADGIISYSVGTMK